MASLFQLPHEEWGIGAITGTTVEGIQDKTGIEVLNENW
jgi:hypothetical protein